jgi:hypothetical protein
MHMKSLVYVSVFAAIFCSCSPTSLVTLSVREPSPVTIPAYFKTIAVVNRSLTTGANKVTDAVDKIFTLEGPNLDRDGSKASIRGLTDELSKDSRFVEIKAPENTGLSTTTPGLFPAPLSWDAVQKICSENNADALFALELFDTDSKISYAADPVKVNTPLGKIPGIYQQATMLTLVKTGWRIYDPAGKNIIDEFAISRQIKYSGRGINPVQAANAIIGRKDAVMEVGNRAGHGYALRIIPFWLRVGRDYYVRGNSNFRIAMRKAQTGNWNEAGDIWMEETKNYKGKVAGRACYNMAIISEINGDLDQAIVWAQRSYENYNNRLALKYVRILKYRKKRIDLLDFQDSEAVSGNYPPADK